jgi:poly-beta-hydroxybutyrate-responsive repressor
MPPGRHHRGPHHGRARGRRRTGGGAWDVDAPIARFVEPATLLALRRGPSHGYELADAVAEIAGLDVDYGNLYRLLRSLEAEEMVTSEWNDELPGRTKRVYELTPQGAELLDAWVTALESTQERLAAFLRTYREGTS